MRLRLLAVLTGACAGLLPAAVALAQEPGDGVDVGEGVLAFGGQDWFNLGLRLGLVLLVIWGAIVAMRWYVRRMNGEGGGGGRQLKIIETRSLGPNRSLHLVRIGNRAVLIGVTAERINQLLAIDDPDEVERLTRAVEVVEPGGGATFSSMVGSLSSLIGSFRGGRPQAARPPLQRPRAAMPPVTPAAGAMARPAAPVTPAAAAMARPVAPRMAAGSRAPAEYRDDRVRELQRAIAAARGETVR